MLKQFSYLLVQLLVAFWWLESAVAELNSPANQRGAVLRIGVLLPSIKRGQELLNQPLKAIQMAVSDFNINSTIRSNVSLEVVANETDGSHWQLLEAAFWQVNVANVIAIIGPSDAAAIRIISPILKEASLPLLTPSAVSFTDKATFHLHPTFFRVAPNDADIGRAVLGLTNRFGWTRIALIYVKDDYGIEILTEALKMAHQTRLKIVGSVVLPEPHNQISEQSIREIRALKDTEANIFVVAVAGSEIGLVLDAAYEVGILRQKSGWIVARCNYGTDVFNAKTMDGILCIHQTERGNGTEALWNKMQANPSPEMGSAPWVDSAYAYNAAMAIAQALELSLSGDDLNTTSPSLVASQFRPTSSRFAKKLLRELESSTFNGISGSFSLSSQGDNAEYTFLNYKSGHLNEIALWTKDFGFRFKENHEKIRWPGNETTPPASSGAENVINALVPISWPFTGFVDPVTDKTCSHLSREKQKASCKIDGVAIRLMNNVADGDTLKVKMNYTPWWKSWNELVKMVGRKDNSYEMGVGSVTFSTERAKWAVFTTSIYDTGIKLLIKRAESKQTGFVEFFKPIQWPVWVLIVMTFLVASLVLIYLDPAAIASETPKVYNKLTPLKKNFHIWVDSTYFSLCTFFGVQHQDNINNNFARIYVVVLCFFVFIIVGAYTANMAAFLTYRRQYSGITGFKDLLGRKVACRNGTSSCAYAANDLSLASLSQFTLVQTGEEAVKALISGELEAYVSETPHLMGLEAKYCGVTIVPGEPEQAHFYAFPTVEGFAYFQQVNTEIKIAREQTFVSEQLKKALNSSCPPFPVPEAAQTITVKDLGGLLILSAGTAVVVVVCKLAYHVLIRARKTAQAFTIYVIDDDQKEPRLGEGDYREWNMEETDSVHNSETEDTHL